MSQSQYYIHDLSSIAFQIGEFVLPWYWLVYMAGYFWVYFCLEKFSKEKLIPISRKDIYDYMTAGFLSMMLGARLTFIFLYNFSYYKDNPIKVFYLWEGGMSFHGALIGILISTFLLARKKQQNFLNIMDSIATSVPLVLAFGRMANFMNGELAGRVTDVSWAVVFPKFYDMSPRHPSQIYQALTEGLLLFIILWLFKSNLKRPGLQSAFFLIGYGSFRFATEFFRMPDKQLGFIALGLSMGQILCLLMITLGLILNFKFRR